MKQFITLLLILMSTIITVAENLEAVVVWAKDGSKVDYILNTKPSISFTDSELIIKVNNGDVEIEYPLNNLLRFTFEKKENASVAQLEENNETFNYSNNTLFFSNLKNNSIITIYTLGGEQILRHNVKDDGNYSISTDSLQSGIYLISVDGMIHKIIKR